MYVCMYKSEIIPNFIHQTQKNLKQQIGSEFLSMEDDEDDTYIGGTIKAAQVEGGKLEEEDVVQNQSSSSSSSVKGKRPLVENPTSASAPAASGTKSQVEEGAKRPCVEEEKTTKPNHTVKDETEEEEEEQIDYGEDWMKDGGYYLGYDFEKGRTVIVGERPRPVCRSFGPPPPNAFTFKRIARRLAETGRPFLRPDDPLGKSPWNPFPFHVPREGIHFTVPDPEA
ncbi:uncharacterized protein LOC110886785 isoform X3 [Helianthus annuus]|uniref:uncharacterized protein LOC110886785 isoform X3 n=1 Tax=Helianthus annuus TaxID=4232 RepID=UPI0016532239|nr:uncharacterized protein LOC110886785 isoform X3 [Helianthus annuus]